MRIRHAVGLSLTLSLTACTDGNKPAAEPQPVDPAPKVETIEIKSIPGPKASPAEPPSPTSSPDPSPVPSPPPPAAPTASWTIQIRLGDWLLEQETLRRFTLRFELHDKTFDLAMIGEFADKQAAEAELERLRTEYGSQGFFGFVRDLSRCDLLVASGGTTFVCEPAGLEQVGPLVYYYPEPKPRESTVPPAIVHPTADTVLVIASDETFAPGHLAIDKAPKFKTWVWHLPLGDLPGKGKVAEPEDGSAPAKLEQRDGLFVHIGGARQAVVFGEDSFEIAKCKCDDLDDKHAEFDLYYRDGHHIPVQTLEVERNDGTRERLLTPSAVPDVQCIAKPWDIKADFQIVAVAGTRLLVVERQRGNECGIHVETRMFLHAFDLASQPVALIGLEQELGSDEVAKLREAAAWALDEQLANYPWDGDGWWNEYFENIGKKPGWAAKLWPEALVLSAVYPDYRTKQRDKALTLQYELGLEHEEYSGEGSYTRAMEPEGMREGSGDWSGWTWVARVSTSLPASSSLTPPAQAQALIDYVNREHREWKVIGWSQGVDAPPAQLQPAHALDGL